MKSNDLYVAFQSSELYRDPFCLEYENIFRLLSPLAAWVDPNISSIRVLLFISEEYGGSFSITFCKLGPQRQTFIKTLFSSI